MASIVPSLLAGNFARLGESLDVVQALGIPTIHIDIMDGHFRPQVSVGQPVVQSIHKATALKLDLHLMIERPERYIRDFVDAGASSLAFHPEATQDVSFGISLAKKLGVKVGLALNPVTPVDACFGLLEDLDYVLIQSAMVGAGAETFMRSAVSKVAAMAAERKARGLSFLIQAEGGIGASEAEELLRAGADILVVGSAIFDKQEQGKAIRAVVRTLSQSASSSSPDAKASVH